MPVVDRSALRLGVFELLWRDDVPDAVVVNEWVELVSNLSTDDSPEIRQRVAFTDSRTQAAAHLT